jgi:hypothetical protein
MVKSLATYEARVRLQVLAIIVCNAVVTCSLTDFESDFNE